MGARFPSTGGGVTVGVNGNASFPLAVTYMQPPAGGGSDDTANLASAIARLPTVDGVARVGIIQLQPGHYTFASTFTHGRGQIIRGAGGQADGIPAGTTTITFTNNGTGWYVPFNLYRWGIEDLTLVGTPANGSQDLMVIGDAGGAIGPGFVRGVGIFNAGRDNLVLASALNTEFTDCMVEQAQRYNLYSTGATPNTSNQIKFTRCRFRVAQQWGIRWSCGTDVEFDNCDIESNSQAVGTDYGGLWVDAATGPCTVTLNTCHFENNRGGGGTGIPVRVENTGGSLFSEVTEVNTNYADGSNSNVVGTGGRVTSLGTTTNLLPHATISASAGVCVFVNPRKNGGGTFSLTDSSNLAVIIGGVGTNSAGPSAISIGSDVQLQRSGAATLLIAGQIDQEPAVNGIVQQSRVSTDGFARWYRNADGQQVYGSGAGAQDTTTQRLAANYWGTSNADIGVQATGRGLRVKEGANCKQGVATLVAGTVTVSNTAITTSSRIVLTAQDNSTTGALRVSARVAATSFTITSSNVGDTGVVAYQVFEPA